ncbi:MAG: abortive infection family protein, partial [Planctomycetes bacterium]|nr:abortive infection family protein [Planctomycetota bacterium]
GNCQAVVGGIAFLRNNLGDAHSREPGAAKPTEADAELAVNVAGAMATFLVRSWHESRTGGPAS